MKDINLDLSHNIEVVRREKLFQTSTEETKEEVKVTQKSCEPKVSREAKQIFFPSTFGNGKKSGTAYFAV